MKEGKKGRRERSRRRGGLLGMACGTSMRILIYFVFTAINRSQSLWPNAAVDRMCFNNIIFRFRTCARCVCYVACERSHLPGHL
jgi:hypothetical protein